MKVSVRQQDPTTTKVDALIVPMPKADRLPRGIAAIDRALGGRIRAYLDAGAFAGQDGQIAGFPAEGIAAKHVVLVGLGEADDVTLERLRQAAGRAIGAVARHDQTTAGLVLPRIRRIGAEGLTQALTEGAILASYQFHKYITLREAPHQVDRLTILAEEGADLAPVRSGVKSGTVIAESVAVSRDLANEPGSSNPPAKMAERARAVAREAGLRAKILTPRELEARGMGGILAVGRGSANPPRLIVLEHGAPKKGARRKPTIALVGKGITFDTGGISLKPGQDMHLMKGDMAGGAAVIGAMRAVGLLGLPLHVIGIVPAAENKPDADAYLPGDIVQTAAGITLEILNTDAEGRVVLSDGLHHATQFAPDAIVDIATLTGAKIIALGTHCCAVMGNDEPLIERVREAGDRAHERAWPLPLWEDYKTQIRGDVGDLKNVGGREGGSITAGALLSYFVADIPWAHLDIAGNEMTARDLPYCPKGATGFGVRLLVELLRSWE